MSKRARLVVSSELSEPGDNYGDTWLQIRADRSETVCTRRDHGEIWTYLGNYVSLSPPAHIVDPLEYFADLIACERLQLNLQYRVCDELQFRHENGVVVMPPQPFMRNAAPLAAFFDPLPDPRLVQSICIGISRGRAREIYVTTCTGVSQIYRAYARDALLDVHREILEQSDTRATYAMQLSRSGLIGHGTRERYKVAALLEPLALRSCVCQWPDYRETRRGPVVHVFICVSGTTSAAHLWPALRQRVARAMSARILQQKISGPNQRIAACWVGLIGRILFQVQHHPFGALSWNMVFPLALDVAVALAPLRLPPYVVLWILQWIPVFGTQRELRLLRLVENVTRRCAALAGHRLACVGKGLRKRARQ